MLEKTHEKVRFDVPPGVARTLFGASGLERNRYSQNTKRIPKGSLKDLHMVHSGAQWAHCAPKVLQKRDFGGPLSQPICVP